MKSSALSALAVALFTTSSLALATGEYPSWALQGRSADSKCAAVLRNSHSNGLFSRDQLNAKGAEDLSKRGLLGDLMSDVCGVTGALTTSLNVIAEKSSTSLQNCADECLCASNGCKSFTFAAAGSTGLGSCAMYDSNLGEEHLASKRRSNDSKLRQRSTEAKKHYNADCFVKTDVDKLLSGVMTVRSVAEPTPLARRGGADNYVVMALAGV